MENKKPYIVKPCSWHKESEYLKKLGIKMIDSPGCGTYVELPEGWTFKTDSDWIAESTTIYDDRGRERIQSTHWFPTKRHINDDSLAIRTRYRMREIGRDEHGKCQIAVIDGNDGSVIFSAVGKCKYLKTSVYCEECGIYLDENYPDWNNPLAYWDE